ncbi:MAG: hypothetical protein IKW58_01830 [Alphaproteobacteria bacterium]|nr:hypothetical protein [Alphaproteobacteria bacterium]
MIDKILGFIEQAGNELIKTRKEKGLYIDFKDKSPVGMVTEADFNISFMFKEFVENNFSYLSYFIVDEESIANYKGDIFDEIEKNEYVFVIDPLDGTLQYAQDIPIYGISVGVFKNKKPYVGALYIPKQNDLVYSNEDKEAFWVKNAFTLNEHKIKLQKEYKTTSMLIVDLQQHFELDKSKNVKKFLFVDYMASVFSNVLIASGRVRSGMFKDWLWDVGGAWPIFSALGYKIFDFKNNKYLRQLNREDFTPKLKFKYAHIIGSEKEVKYLKNIIIKDKELD